ncbi:hypothetical protein DFR30_1539 [Thiogranum longum]|uniref:Uncharacterized protein n=1 Tax=Thiogranum longum TaxID=1537524 RepID=A0A4R1HCI6_9GAMM|nr:hypothetical protein [Thiogranum longum]TCK18263.1 hypothetical protein DFR30_1539 [Thiogranum longum]
MWHMIQEQLQPGSTDPYRITADDGSVLSYAQVIEHWGNNTSFALFFSKQLAASAFEAFLWETPPITRDSLQRPFEYVLVDSPRLARASPDSTAFAEHFETDRGQMMVSFDNLGGDARLIAPCPLEPVSACTHLAAFLRQAPANAVVELWRSVSEAVSSALSDQPLWVSTCGLGVYWLHVRLDSVPKYYRYAPYQTYTMQPL